MPRVRVCVIDDCENRAIARGWCQKHYSRWRSNGDPLIAQVIIGDDVARWWAKVDRRGDDECWPWLGGRDVGGYGIFHVQGKLRKAHRWAYEQFVGPLPPDMTLDHVRARGCTIRHCVNYLRHLEPVTMRENTLRGSGPSALNAQKTHCKHGHEFTPENTLMRTDGSERICKKCRAKYAREWWARTHPKAPHQVRPGDTPVVPPPPAPPAV